jgi:hypothetical protein
VLVGTRALTWGLTLPLAGAGVLGGHELTYRVLDGERSAGFHGYLAHAPQLIAILLTVGLLGLAVEQRTLSGGSYRFLLLGATVFVAQEHVERLVHGGSLPFLLTDRAFLLGLLVQVPIGLVCLAIARLVTRALNAPGMRRLHLWTTFWLTLDTRAHAPFVASAPVALRGRGPPSPLCF